MERELLPSNLKWLRESMGLTQEQFAEKIYKSRQALSSYEVGSKLPDIHTIIEIGEVTNTCLCKLLRTDLRKEALSKQSPEQRPLQKEEMRNEYEQR